MGCRVTGALQRSRRAPPCPSPRCCPAPAVYEEGGQTPNIRQPLSKRRQRLSKHRQRLSEHHPRLSEHRQRLSTTPFPSVSSAERCARPLNTDLFRDQLRHLDVAPHLQYARSGVSRQKSASVFLNAVSLFLNTVSVCVNTVSVFRNAVSVFLNFVSVSLLGRAVHPPPEHRPVRGPAHLDVAPHLQTKPPIQIDLICTGARRNPATLSANQGS